MQNNVGLQTAYWSGTTPALDIHQIIELTKKANMDTIELKAGDFVPLTIEGRAALRKEIEDAGLSITINGTGLRPERDVSSSDEESHKAGIKHLCTAHISRSSNSRPTGTTAEFLMDCGIHVQEQMTMRLK